MLDASPSRCDCRDALSDLDGRRYGRGVRGDMRIHRHVAPAHGIATNPSNRAGRSMKPGHGVPVGFAPRHGSSTAAGVVGNVLEGYDFALFGLLAPVLGTRFFPSGDPIVSLLQVFAVLAAGYVVRPLGGILFASCSDRFGRPAALLASVVLMASATTALGLLPSYATAGWWAPALLVVLRLVQGISVGGELIASIVWIAEIAPYRRRGLFTSWTTLSLTGGMLLGSAAGTLVQALLTHAQIERFGWRVPFLAASLLGLSGFWLRRGLREQTAPAATRAVTALDEHPLRAALRHTPRQIGHLCALLPLFTGGLCTLFVWLPTYLGQMVVPPVEFPLLLNTSAMAVLLAAIPLGGLAADHLGRRRVLVTAQATLALLALPLWLVLSSGGAFAALAAQLIAALLMAFVLGTIPVTMIELFPAHVRSSAAGLGYNLTAGVLGGSAPLVCTWLINRTASVLAPALYLALLATVSVVAASRLDHAALTTQRG